MDTRELRASFLRFAGQDRYRKFVRTINGACRSKNRLLFWQEELWQEFAATIADPPNVDKEVMDAFNVCDVHD